MKFDFVATNNQWKVLCTAKIYLFQQKFPKKLYDFNRHELGFLTYECDVKTIELYFRSRIKNPTPSYLILGIRQPDFN